MGQRNFSSYGNIPAVTKNLLIINALLWAATLLMQGRVDLMNVLGLHFPGSENFRPHQLFTYMFMHGGLTHLFFNMFAVYMFGRVMESVWGSRRFLSFYIITGVGAGLINMLVTYLRIRSCEANLDPETVSTVFREGAAILKQGKNYVDSSLGELNALINTPTVGASGAVFGILLAFGMYFPNVEMYIIPFPFPIKAKYLVIGYGAIELFAGIADFSWDNVAHYAHLGGMFFGLILALYWKKKDKNNGRYIY